MNPGATRPPPSARRRTTVLASLGCSTGGTSLGWAVGPTPEQVGVGAAGADEQLGVGNGVGRTEHAPTNTAAASMHETAAEIRGPIMVRRRRPIACGSRAARRDDRPHAWWPLADLAGRVAESARNA